MVYGYGGTFEADPDRLQSFLTENQSLAEDIQSIASDFVSALEPYSDWFGIDDQFAVEAGGQYRREVDSVTAALRSIGEAVAGVTEGRIQELASIRNAQGYAMDNMQQAQTALNDVGVSGAWNR
jgi:conjugal transfer/entry exclusion protein